MSTPETFDAIVIGAGPAGSAAAIAASEAGFEVLLIDEGRAAGGQVYRAPTFGSGPASATTRSDEGDNLRERLAASRVACRFGERVWLAERGFRVHSLGPGGPFSARAKRLIVAAGAQERHLPIPGWTLPGVIGLAGATVLMKSEGILPGRRIVVAGTGPLLLLVAAMILDNGGEVAAIIDANGQARWLSDLPSLLSRPDLLVRGLAWLARIRRAGVPVLRRRVLRQVEGESEVEGVIACRLGADGSPAASGEDLRIACDAVCYGYGLAPATEITRLLGASHGYEARSGGWSAIADAGGLTDVEGLYVCGDGAGVGGAAAAALGGEAAGRAAAASLGKAPPAASRRFAQRTRRAARFGQAMTALAMPPPGLLAAITAETLVCRCEGVTRAEIEGAVSAGAHTLAELKSMTRCGMGPCGGRICEDSAAALIARRTGKPLEAIGQGTARPPLRPVPLALIAGEFDYLDLPFPEPAPQ